MKDKSSRVSLALAGSKVGMAARLAVPKDAQHVGFAMKEDRDQKFQLRDEEFAHPSSFLLCNCMVQRKCQHTCLAHRDLRCPASALLLSWHRVLEQAFPLAAQRAMPAECLSSA